MTAASKATNPEQLHRRGLRLEYATLAWNVAGVVILAVAAIGASTVVIWELTDTGAGRERLALRLIGWAFFAIAVYFAVQASELLAAGQHAGTSYLGIAWTGLTMVAMLCLAAGKAATGKALGNPVLRTEGRVTLVDAYLAGAVLVGLALNAAVGWWWADPAAGYVIVLCGVKEGRAALREAGTH